MSNVHRPSDPELFPLGTRVEIHGHFEWPHGTRGTIEPYPGPIRDLCSASPHTPEDFIAAGLARKCTLRVGITYGQWVKFDEPTDDGSGDGPYLGAEVLIENLRQWPNDA